MKYYLEHMALIDHCRPFLIIEGVLLRPLPFADPTTLEPLGDVSDGADSIGAPNVSPSQLITLFP